MLTRWFCCFALFCALVPKGAFCQAPDLVISPSQVPASRWVGASFSVQALAVNRGDADAGANTLRFALSPLGTPADRSDDIPLAECRLPVLPPGGRSSNCGPTEPVSPPNFNDNDLVATIPADVSPGEYLILVTVDADAEVVESDETNNSILLSSFLPNGTFTVTPPGFQCVAQTGVAALARSTGLAELAGDVVLSCEGGSPTPLGQSVPFTDIDVELDAPITSRKLNGDYVEAMLLIDEPSPEHQVTCPGGAACDVVGVGAEPGVNFASGLVPNVYQGLLVAPNRIRFQHVPIDPPGESTTRIFRIVNVRVDATQIETPASNELPSLYPQSANATVSATGPNGFFLHDLPQVVAFAEGSKSPLELTMEPSANPDYDYDVTFGEESAMDFLRRNTATSASDPGELADQSIPGSAYFTETGFYNSSLPAPLDQAGLPDTGTRLLIRFDDVPSGQQVFVSVGPTSTGCGSSICDPPAAVLVGFELDGTGGGASDPVLPTQLAPTPGIVAVPTTAGSGAAVYEILESSPFSIESLTFGVKLVGEGKPTITGMLAPISADNTASATAPVPRFVDPSLHSADTPGLHDPVSSFWFLRSTASAGAADWMYSYGPSSSGWIPLTGDWDGTGSSTAGLYDPDTGMWFLRYIHGPGPASAPFSYGPGGLGWRPVVGDWNGDGKDSPGLYDPATGMWFLSNIPWPGSADYMFSYGPGGLGWIPIVGDWDGDGEDTPGLYDPVTGMWFLRNHHTPGAANLVFSYGPGGLGWIPLAGDWDADGVDTVGLYDPVSGIWFLRNSNSAGPADNMFSYGPGSLGWLPVVGAW